MIHLTKKITIHNNVFESNYSPPSDQTPVTPLKCLVLGAGLPFFHHLIFFISTFWSADHYDIRNYQDCIFIWVAKLFFKSSDFFLVYRLFRNPLIFWTILWQLGQRHGHGLSDWSSLDPEWIVSGYVVNSFFSYLTVFCECEDYWKFW